MNNKKKVLVLGGKPIGSIELVKRLKELGYYVIVSDYLPKEQSPAKKIADESWDISTANIEELSEMIEKDGISGIMTGVHEFNINRMLDLCEKYSFSCYCSRETWAYCDNKLQFKNLCLSNGIPIAKTYSKDELIDNNKAFPVIVKPIDGSGSRGFHIVSDYSQLEEYYNNAASFSPSHTVLIEEFVPYNTVIIHYTMINGRCIYSGMSDKISVKFPLTGASVMGIQTFPSKGESVFLDSLNEKVSKMFENAGFQNGPIWIEAFYDGKDQFVFNEMGYRFGGSLTYYPVKHFTGINQLDLIISNALDNYSQNTFDISLIKPSKGNHYCILPIHIHPGKISKIEINPLINPKNNYPALVQVHFEGDEIQNWGSAQQVFAYAHIIYSTPKELSNRIKDLFEYISVKDDLGINMIYTLFDIQKL